MTDSFSDLIPELSQWNEGRGIDVDGWICGVGSFEHLIGYIELLWPTFVEHDDCVFLQGFSEEAYRGFMGQTGGNRRAVEAVMNHVHITDLFGNPALVPTRPQILHIGRKLKDIWACKLRRDFPGRSFAVSFPEEPEDDLLDYQVTFFQAPRAPA